MELRDALNQISEIRRQMAKTQVFRGYRSATTAFSGLLAIAASIAQPYLVPDPAHAIPAYLGLWLGVATLSISVVGVEIFLRHRRLDSPLQREITAMAIEQFIPSLAAGLLLTLVLVRFAPETLWMLPGLWAILCGLGIFASRRMLPGGAIAVAGFYLLAGLLCLAIARDALAFSPLAMGLTFGPGQLIAAGILYWALEHNHDRE